MATGIARIFRVTTAALPAGYAYTWKDDENQPDEDNVVAGRTLAQAYSEVGALLQALPGQIKSVQITGTSL